MIFKRIKRKIDNFAPYNVFLAIATNIPQRLKTGFVLQGAPGSFDLVTYSAMQTYNAKIFAHQTSGEHG